MKYANTEIKINALISYFNQHRISLIPPFQRGTVWNLKTRKALIVNMVQRRPIPAVFLYKEAAGAQFEYNILDGKQRLESLILFVGDKRPQMRVNKVRDYFYGKSAANDANFSIELEDGKPQCFADLSDELVRQFGEYQIPLIEIDLEDEGTNIDEVVGLFVDINQYGEKVSRFDVVKALGKDPLFQQVFDLIAIKQKRKKAFYYRSKDNPYVRVLKNLRIVARLSDRNAKVDRMWERLTELALFARSGKNRAPGSILKSFIKPSKTPNPILKSKELRKLRVAFEFLAHAYQESPALAQSKLAIDQPQFYTLATILISTNLLSKYPDDQGATAALVDRLTATAAIVDGTVPTPKSLEAAVNEYRDVSARQTTNPNRREARHKRLLEIINAAQTGGEIA